MTGGEWETARDLPWAKVHDRWFSSPSHVDLEDVTLLVGIRMLLLANRRGRQADGSGHVVNGAGLPMSIAGIAREAHSTPGRVEHAIGELIAVGTLADLGGGRYSFPRLQAWQESPDAARKRQHRREHPAGQSTGQSADKAATSTDDGPDSPGTVLGHGVLRRSEDQTIRVRRREDDQTTDTERVDPPPADADAGPGHTQGALVLSPPPAPSAQAGAKPPKARSLALEAQRYAAVEPAVRAWNAAAAGSGLTPAVERPMKRRDGHLSARLAEVGLEQLEHVFGWLATSPHHTGGSSSGWAADLSWVVSSAEHLATLVQRADRAASGAVPAAPAAPMSHAQRLMARAMEGTPAEREELRRWQEARG